MPGRTTTTWVGSFCAGHGGVGRVLHGRDERRLQRSAGHGIDRADHLAVVAGAPVGAHDRDREAGSAGQLLLEGALQAGQAQLVTGGVARRSVVLRLLDHLRRRLADPPQQGGGEASARVPAGAWRSGTRRREVVDLRADGLEGGTPQRDDGDELTRRRRLDVGDDLLGGGTGGGGQPLGERLQVGHLRRVDPDVDHLGRREQRLAVGVGDGRALGQAAVELEVLPLPQLRVHDRGFGDDLPLLVALPQPQRCRVAPVGGGGEVPRRGPGDGGGVVLHRHGADLAGEDGIGQVRRRLVQQRGRRLRRRWWRPPRPRSCPRPRRRGTPARPRGRRPRRCRSRPPGRARRSASRRGEPFPDVSARFQIVTPAPADGGTVRTGRWRSGRPRGTPPAGRRPARRC